MDDIEVVTSNRKSAIGYHLYMISSSALYAWNCFFRSNPGSAGVFAQDSRLRPYHSQSQRRAPAAAGHHPPAPALSGHPTNASWPMGCMMLPPTAPHKRYRCKIRKMGEFLRKYPDLRCLSPEIFGVAEVYYVRDPRISERQNKKPRN